MLKKASENEVKLMENMRGGPGTTRIEHLATADELNQKGRMYARVTLVPGAGIGWHVHENESEIFYFLKGQASVNDNGTEITALPGDVTVTAHGCGHSVTNRSSEDLEFIALIVFN